jgi:serine/threonine-protein kinase
VLTALQKLPADRFATAKEFADALVQPAPAAVSQSGTVALPTTARARTRSPALAGMALLSVLSLLVAAWSLTRRGSATGAAPAVYDAALPDSAPMLFAATTATRSYGAPLRGISVAPNGEFVIYSARQGDSTALWQRSLRDASAAPIRGTTGAIAPRISPDGSQVAFMAGDRVLVVPIGGGEPRVLLEGQAVATLEWSSPTTLLTATLDGYRMVWLDPQVGQTRTKDIVARCLFGRWIAAERRLMCRLNGRAVVVDPESGENWVVHVTAPDGSDGPPLTGSGFVVLDGDMLVYLSVDGDLRAAPYDATRHRIGRPATLSTAVRGEALGDVQLDVTPDGTLVYAPGTNAEIGQLVRLRPGTPPEPLVAERAAFQRFDLSPDQRFLAAVVQTTEDQELRIYDLRDRQRTVWLHAQDVRHPLWSPTGDRLLVGTATGTRGSLLVGMPGSGLAPDTLYAADSVTFLRDPVDFVDAHDLLVGDWVNGVALRADPTVSPMRFDTVLTEARFPTVAPGGKWIAYMSLRGGGLAVTSYPTPGRRWQIAADGVEPQWLSPTELLYRAGVTWYLARIDPVSGELAAQPTLWGRDMRFSDTPGWSNRSTRDGGIIYVQGPPETSGAFLRVVPNWVSQARAAVAEANK